MDRDGLCHRLSMLRERLGSASSQFESVLNPSPQNAPATPSNPLSAKQGSIDQAHSLLDNIFNQVSYLEEQLNRLKITL